MSEFDFKSFLVGVPHSSGVYFFKNKQGAIIYIGKAKDLNVRLSSYLYQKEIYEKTSLLIEHATCIEWTETATELDAMILEATLIKQHKPSFNVLLKEGNPFLYFLITKAKIPEFLIVRSREGRGLYFGPFIDKKSTRTIFDFLEKKFRLKICNKKISNGCIEYHLGICSGSCLDTFDIVAYKKRLQHVKIFLQDGYKGCYKQLQKELELSNKALTFEYSRELVEVMKSLESFSLSLESTILTQEGVGEFIITDIWVYNIEASLLTCYQEQGGLISLVNSWYLEESCSLDETPLYQEYFLSYYRNNRPAKVILMNVILPDKALIESFLSQLYDSKTRIGIINPTQGYQFQILQLAVVMQKKMFFASGDAAVQIQKMCGLQKIPQIIDCFDISHMQGTVLVGAAIRFIDGKPYPLGFRNFIIKSFQGNNDYAALQEIVVRRYKNKSEYPDLMIIDGGKGQRNAVKKVFPFIPTASLAKKEERFFTEAHPDGIILDCKTAAGRQIIALRDYTHHAAVTFHRKRSKNERLLKKI